MNDKEQGNRDENHIFINLKGKYKAWSKGHKYKEKTEKYNLHRKNRKIQPILCYLHPQAFPPRYPVLYL